jgi:hypothetical protein
MIHESNYKIHTPWAWGAFWNVVLWPTAAIPFRQTWKLERVPGKKNLIRLIVK